MAKKRDTNPRKRPTQSRAQVTADAILEATAHILVARGYEALTTNHVARAAGVSIGSLYQYFPSKVALVAALVDRHIDRMAQLVTGELARSFELPFADAVGHMVGALVEAHRVDPPLYRVLVEQLPHVERLGKIREVDRVFEDLLAAGLAARSAEVDVEDPKMCAFLMVQSAKAVTLTALVERPDYANDPKLTRELARMFVAYAGRRSRGDGTGR